MRRAHTESTCIEHMNRVHAESTCREHMHRAHAESTCIEYIETEAFKETMHDKRREGSAPIHAMLWRVRCTSIPRAQGPWQAKGWWIPASEDLCWGGVSGSMAGQCVRGEASTAGGIILQHMDMTKLMMNDGMWSVIKWAIIWPG